MTIQSYLARFPIAQRLWIGFSIVLGILAVAVAIAWISLVDTGRRVSKIVDEIQPAVLASTELMNRIKETTTSLGFYLLTQEDLHRKAYAEHLNSIEGSVDALRKSLDARDENIQSELREIERMVQKFRSFQPQLLEIATQQNKNYAALGYAAQHINPLSQELLQSVSSMIMSETDEPASEKRKGLLLACEELRYAWSNVMTNLRVYVVFGNKDVYANMQLFADSAGKQIEKIRGYKNILTFEQEEAIATIEEIYKRFQGEMKQLATIFEGDRARMDAYMVRAEISPLVRRIDEKVNAIVETQRTLIRDTSESLGNQVTFATGLMFLLLIAGLGIGGTVSLVMTRMIAQPLKHAARAMRDIARGEGDLTQRLNVEGRDEIGTVADAFNQFAGNIQELIKQVGGATRQLSNAAGKMRDATARSCTALDQQKKTSAEIVTSIQQMTDSAANVAQGAELAAEAARKADQETTSGRQTVGGALAAINTLATETQETAGVIERLGREIQSIGTIIDVIRGITEQTNLLALNAAIEAARAGEQGRGFAVVADEVRTLATRTASETRQIQNKVETLQTDATTAVQRMIKNSEVARSTIDLASKAGNSLQAITKAVSNISRMTEQIASAAEQQSSAATSVRGSVETIDRLTSDTDRSVDDVSRHVDNLGQLSGTLSDLVTRFKV